jgi:predicted RNA-binding protein YlqC (UPF0109 family)
MAGHAAAVVTAAARALVDEPSEIVVRETVHRGVTVVELTVAPSDVGKVVGRQGRTAEALRTLVAATAHHHGTKATLEIRGADSR